MEMETSEISGEAAASTGADSDHYFKTPKLLISGQSRTRFEDSGYLTVCTPESQSSSSSFMNGLSASGYKLNPSCTSELWSSTQRCDSKGAESLFISMDHSSSVCSNWVNVMEGSQDSGLGSIGDCESMNESEGSYIEALDQSKLSPSTQKRPGTPQLTKSSCCKIPCMVSTPHIDVQTSMWQSTPAVESRSDRSDCSLLNFGTPFLAKAETKFPTAKSRRLCRLSRDLYRPSGRRSCYLSSWGSSIQPVSPGPLKTSHVGRETVDILSFLGLHSRLQPALDMILGYLEPPDLCRASQVSHSWKNVIETVPCAKQRKEAFVEQHLQRKENLCQSVKKSDDAESTSDFPRRGRLLSITNFNHTVDTCPAPTRSPPVSPSKVRFHLFVKEAHKLENGQTLVQCPKCKLPSVRETLRTAKCTRRGCQFHFCTHCFCEFHGDHPCRVFVKHSRRQTAVGSRESRRNLKRL